MERSLHVDLTTAEHAARFFLDGGVFGPVGRLRLDETGTEMGDVSGQSLSDPSGRTLFRHMRRWTRETSFERDDWNVRIKTSSEMTATKTAFLLRASVTCWDGEEEFHHVQWDHSIPRNGM